MRGPLILIVLNDSDKQFIVIANIIMFLLKFYRAHAGPVTMSNLQETIERYQSECKEAGAEPSKFILDVLSLHQKADDR